MLPRDVDQRKRAVLDDYRLFTTQLVTLWAVLDPLGHLPLFLGATMALSEAGRRRAAWLSVVIAFGILTAFSILGQVLLHAMGISLLSFQIAGGVIVFLFAVNMVIGASEEASIQVPPGEEATGVAIYPLATPIIAGPGSMLTMVLLMDNNRYSLVQQGVTVVALAAVLAALLCVLLLAERVRCIIGANGAHLLRRIMGLILAALAVNMILSAVALWLHLPAI